MMIKLNPKQINEIAQSLDCGTLCYVHKETGNVLDIPDFENNWGFDEELLEEDIKEVKENEAKYLKLTPMDSHTSYGIMEKFISKVEDIDLRRKLEYAISNPKPFRNFKYEIDFVGGDLLEEWYAFKQKEYEKWVVEEIKYKLNDEA